MSVENDNKIKGEMIETALKAAFGALDIPVVEVKSVPLWGQIVLRFDDVHVSRIVLPQTFDASLMAVVNVPNWNLSDE
jgi:hypothetical protein